MRHPRRVGRAQCRPPLASAPLGEGGARPRLGLVLSGRSRLVARESLADARPEDQSDRRERRAAFGQPQLPLPGVGVTVGAETVNLPALL
jgi:hypothetical protein